LARWDRHRRLGRRQRSNAIDGDDLETFYRSKDDSEIERPRDEKRATAGWKLWGNEADDLLPAGLKAIENFGVPLQPSNEIGNASTLKSGSSQNLPKILR
jgi:hypothetical protein